MNEPIDVKITWKGVMPLILIALENGTGEGQDMARQELVRLATVADEGEKIRQKALEMQVAVALLLSYGGTQHDKWFDVLAEAQRGLASVTHGSRAEFDTIRADKGIKYFEDNY
jgi:hypothetical protein